jgi:plasmid stabilization system protein ParE
MRSALMAHRLSRRAQDDSDDTWLYLARESGSKAVTDRMVDTLTERFTLAGPASKIGKGTRRRARGRQPQPFPWAMT